MGFKIAELFAEITADTAPVRQSLGVVETACAQTQARMDSLAQWAKAHALRDAGNIPAAMAAGVKAMALNNEAVVQEQLAASLAAMEREAAEAQAASDRKISTYLREYQVRISLEERYYAATHSYLDAALREHDNHYAALRAKHMNNAKMLALIDKAYSAERGRIIETNATMGPNAFLKLQSVLILVGSSAGLTGRQIQSLNLALMALGARGNLLSSRTLASLKSSLASVGSSLAAMGPVGWVIAGTLAVLGGAFYGMHRHVKDAEDRLRRYTAASKELLDLLKRMKEASPSYKAPDPKVAELDQVIAAAQERIAYQRKKISEAERDSQKERVPARQREIAFLERQVELRKQEREEYLKTLAIKKATDAEDRLKGPVRDFIRSIDLESEMRGMSVRMSELYRLSLMATTEEEKRSIAPLLAAAGAVARVADAMDRARDVARIYTDKISDLQRELDLLTGGEAAKQKWEIIDLSNLGLGHDKILEIMDLQQQIQDATKQNEIADAAKAEMEQLTQFVQAELDKIKTPLEKFKEYHDTLQKAFESGILDKAAMEDLLSARMKEILGGVNRAVNIRASFVGLDKMSRKIQESLLNPEDDTEKKQLVVAEDQKKLLEAIRDNTEKQQNVTE